jgi:hypothetical protein
MCLGVEKQNLLEKKTKLCLDSKIERHDAVGLVHRAWIKSFAKGRQQSASNSRPRVEPLELQTA